MSLDQKDCSIKASSIQKRQKARMMRALHPFLPVRATQALRIVFFFMNILVEIGTLRSSHSYRNYTFFSFWVQLGQLFYSTLLLYLELSLIYINIYRAHLFDLYREISLFVLGAGPVILFVFYTFWRPFAISYYSKDKLFYFANECVHFGFVLYIFLEFFYLQNVDYSCRDLQFGIVIGNIYLVFNTLHYFFTRKPIYLRVINYGDGVFSRWFIFFVIGFVSLLISTLCVFWNERNRKRKDL